MSKIERIQYGEAFLDYRQGSGNTIEIFDIAVPSQGRRKGTGRRLLLLLLDRISKDVKMVWAITRAENFIAQQFYEELRFRVVGVLRNFYQDGAETVDAIMYGRDIGSQA